ncbi:hypothetical protein MUK42_37398 [Musa troglodytarum]|uniref:Uncharacterized protein n=1 Tax=Musa troglodytarum TaxID=320322 RepID=A0A9E7JBV2_9LILI|nr:hypothetical protein MUK42_37398 [Musa troglodytarum]
MRIHFGMLTEIVIHNKLHHLRWFDDLKNFELLM